MNVTSVNNICKQNVVYICILNKFMTCKRYLPPAAVVDFLTKLDLDPNCRTVLGHSVENRPIECIQLGSGAYQVLMWSQMHGNETTTTKALMDFIPWFLDQAQVAYRKAFRLTIILQLNPDGAQHYTRVNANGVDLNRDAINLSQPESQLLLKLYNSIQPDLCLNLHGQRTLYAAGLGGPSASLSFLAPAANQEREITSARAEAMRLIAALTAALTNDLPEAIGRYDDTFNPNCVGDTFTQRGTPTILFEAGHVAKDYQREKTRRYVFKAYCALFEALLNNGKHLEVEHYFSLPQNSIDFYDIILEGVTIQHHDAIKKNQKLGLSFREVLKDSQIEFHPEMKAFGDNLKMRGHHNLMLPSEIQSKPINFQNNELIKDFHLLNFIWSKIKIN